MKHQKGPEQFSVDHSALIDFNQLISYEDIKILGTVAQELQLTDFDETTIILTAMTWIRAPGFLFFRIYLLKTEKSLSLGRLFFIKSIISIILL